MFTLHYYVVFHLFFCSILVYSVLFCSVLFYSIVFYSITFCYKSILLYVSTVL